MLNSDIPRKIQSFIKLNDYVVNTEASDYFSANYMQIIKQAKIMSLKSKQDVLYQDVVNDVYISILQAEQSGCGYNSSLGYTVEEFIFGRIKKYMKNTKYRVLGEQVKTTNGSAKCISAYASEELEHAYNNAKDESSEVSYELLENTLDIEEEIRTCLRGDLEYGIDIEGLITRPEFFAEGRASVKKVMRTLAYRLDKELLESLRVVLEYENKNIIKDLVEKVKKEFMKEQQLVKGMQGLSL